MVSICIDLQVILSWWKIKAVLAIAVDVGKDVRLVDFHKTFVHSNSGLLVDDLPIYATSNLKDKLARGHCTTADNTLYDASGMASKSHSQFHLHYFQI